MVFWLSTTGAPFLVVSFVSFFSSFIKTSFVVFDNCIQGTEAYFSCIRITPEALILTKPAWSLLTPDVNSGHENIPHAAARLA
jgi:hypothetical protein